MDNKKIHQKFYLLIIFSLSFIYSNCAYDCSSINCHTNDGLTCSSVSGGSCDSSKCKARYGIKTCHDCSGISGGYYTIDPNGNCLIGQCYGDKIIDQSKECTSQSVTNLNKLGDIYYSNTPSYATCSSFICSCNSYYYTENIHGNKELKCQTSASTLSSSGYKFYNPKTG